MPPRTAAATEATQWNAARLAAKNPLKVAKATRTVGAALAEGTITADDLAAAAAIAASAPAPDAETLAKLRALLPGLHAETGGVDRASHVDGAAA